MPEFVAEAAAELKPASGRSEVRQRAVGKKLAVRRWKMAVS